MTVRRILILVGVSAVVGLVLGVALSGPDLISIRVWIGGGLATALTILAKDALSASALEPAKLVPIWGTQRTKDGSELPVEIRRLQSAVAAAEHDPQSFNRHLKPELESLAAHYLPRRYGIDPSDVNGVKSTLGDVAWLIGPKPADRAPTLDELERFVLMVCGDEVLTPEREGVA